ncbi:MAG: Holliday junction branch migration protein RuvA [Candidatus Cloacimonetes bacterium]|nr:Holliday junction branch migration protein RuvA [Candidatus Cloacimonadota bacterium]
MYAYLEGILAEKNHPLVVIDCAGVGYELSVPMSTFEKLPARGENLKLLVHYQFTETDGARLFGFLSQQEKDLFRLLLGVSKIGPRTAMAVLSTLSAADFERAVLEGNISMIASVPGLGKKSAERLVLELKDKIGGLGVAGANPVSRLGGITEDAFSALITLGYSPQDVRNFLTKLAQTKKYNSAEELVKDTIKELHKRAK